MIRRARTSMRTPLPAAAAWRGTAAILAIAARAALRTAGRTAGTVAAIALGVAVLAVSLGLGRGLRDAVAIGEAGRWGGVDVVASAPRPAGSGVAVRATGIPSAAADRIRDLSTVASVATVATRSVSLADAAGRPLGSEGAVHAETWVPAPATWALVAGTEPRGPGQVVLDAGTAADGGIAPGDRVVLRTPELLPAVVVGLIGTLEGDVAAAAVALWTTDATAHLTGPGGAVDLLLVDLAAGADPGAAMGAVRDLLPASVAVRSGADHATAAAGAAAQRLQVVDALLGSTTAVALAVAVIGGANVLTLSAARRRRDVALLRAVGATRQQVLLAGLVEHAVIGLLAGVAGLLLGGLLALPAAAAARVAGLGAIAGTGALPDGTTVAICLAVGAIVAIAAGLRPAWSATGVPPVVAASSAGDLVPEGHGRPLSILVLLLGLGTVSIGGLAADLTLLAPGVRAALVGGGALALLSGAALVAGDVVRVLLTPLAGVLRRVGGVAGELAWTHAVREHRRTAGAATGLLVSAALIAVVGVLAQSLHTAVVDRTAEAVQADLVVQARSYDGAGLPADLADRLAALPEVARTAAVGLSVGQVAGQESVVSVADGRALLGLLALDVVSGSLADVTGTGIGVDAGRAAAAGWTLGSEVEVHAPGQPPAVRHVAAVFDSGPGDGVGTVVVPRGAWDGGRADRGDVLVLVGLAAGVAVDDGRAAVIAAVADPALAAVMDPAAYAVASAGDVAPLAAITIALLAVACLVALLGIGTTMALAVSERGRQIGLLRAVGQTRGQVRAMVRWESALIAGLGTAAGVVLGVLVGWAAVGVLAQQLAGVAVDVPLLALAGVVLAGVVAGIGAGTLPAIRAARLPVLTAIGRG